MKTDSLWNSINYSRSTKSKSSGLLKRGLAKKGHYYFTTKRRRLLTRSAHWRPITLLNADLKIAAKAIAKRLGTVLPNLIHPEQTGFVKGRYIGENILISDVLDFTKEQKISGILVALDFREAFDSLEWPFIMRILDAFNFGSSIKLGISTFYTNVESAVLNNGYMTNWFQPSKGVRQGCPLSHRFCLSSQLY